MSSEFENRPSSFDLDLSKSLVEPEHDSLASFRLGGSSGPTIFNPGNPRPEGAGSGSGNSTIDMPPISSVTDAARGAAAPQGEQVAWEYGPAHRPRQRFYLPFYSEIGWFADKVTDAILGKRKS